MILSRSEAGDFFPMMSALDAYTNQRFRCVPEVDGLDAMRVAGVRERMLVREARLRHPEVLEAFARENPFGLSERSLRDVRLLRHAVAGRFFVERVLKSHAVFIGAGDVVYAVGGLTEPVDAVVARVHPRGVAALVDAVLVPWRGRIVWDGLVEIVDVEIGPGIRRAFKDRYATAKERGEIVTTLGEPVAPKKPKRPAHDWRPAVAEIVAAVDKLGKPETAPQAATFALLDCSARLAQAALEGDEDAVAEAAMKVHRALRRVLATLER